MTKELFDYRNGKEVPWREKKLANVEYANLLSMLQYLKTERVSICADILRFSVLDTGYLRLKQTWFCKSRLCPICAWRRSKLHAFTISRIVEEAVSRQKSGRWLFITLTTKNTTDSASLSEEISKYSVAIRKMLKRKEVAKSVLGFFRGIEVTVKKEDGSYNQHAHLLLFVRDSYFKKGNYISQSDWVTLWQKAMKLDYEPSVNVKAIKGANEQERFKAVLEVAKYPVKTADYLEGDLYDNLKALDDLEKALSRKRLIAYGGMLKEIQKELNLQDAESDNADLISVGEDREDGEETDETVVAVWDRMDKRYYI